MTLGTSPLIAVRENPNIRLAFDGATGEALTQAGGRNVISFMTSLAFR